MIIYYKELVVDNCLECPNTEDDAPCIGCKVSGKVIGCTDSLYDIMKLRNNVHETCPFRNLKQNKTPR